MEQEKPKQVDKTTLDEREYRTGQIKAIVAVLAHLLIRADKLPDPELPEFDSGVFLDLIKTVVRDKHGKRHGDYIAGADDIISELKRVLDGIEREASSK